MRDTHMNFCFQNSWLSREKVVFVPLYQTPAMRKCQRQKFCLSGRNIKVYRTTENWKSELPWALHIQITSSQGEMQGAQWFPWLQSLKKSHQTTQNHVQFFVSQCPKYFGSFLFWQSLMLWNQWLKKAGWEGITSQIAEWKLGEYLTPSLFFFFFTWTRTWITLLPNLTTGTEIGTNMAFLVFRKTVHLHDSSWTQSLFLNPKKQSKKALDSHLSLQGRWHSPYSNAALLQEHPVITKIRTQAERLLGIKDNQSVIPF